MHKVRITTTDEEFSLPTNACLTDAEELKVNGLEFGCRSGACGICAIEVAEGGENIAPQKKRETKFLNFLGHNPETIRLACQCRVRGDIVIKPAEKRKPQRRQRAAA